MENQFFNFNDPIGSGRIEPLVVSKFLSDLEEVFKKHSVNSIELGYIGFANDKFGIANSTLDIEEKKIFSK